jgi:hypothetical protein
MNNVKMDKDVRRDLLEKIADLHGVPEGAYNIRENGEGVERQCTDEITIETKTDKPGINIIVKSGTKNKSVHIPVIITKTGLTEMVYNDFIIGDDCDVLIVAGCGIHNTGDEASAHDGVHSFEIGENSRVRYIEKHYGDGNGSGERIMNPQMTANLKKGASLEIESVQIGGIDSTDRKTTIIADEDCEVLLAERLMTDGHQKVNSDTEIVLNGKNSKAKQYDLFRTCDTNPDPAKVMEALREAGCAGQSVSIPFNEDSWVWESVPMD